jgi:glucose-6-phosphate isomerase
MNKAALHIDDAHLLSDDGRAAPTRAECLALSPRLDALRERLQRWRAGADPSFLGLPFIDAEPLLQRGRELARKLRRTIVLGIGGSSLGGEMLTRVLGRDGAHNVSFYDNLDPTTLFDPKAVDWNETLLLVVSKSGNTVETLGQFLAALPELELRLGAKMKQHVIAITENRDGALAKLATQLGIEIIAHPPVGGRFSVLSVVGLLPAAIAGVDVTQLLAGARAMAERVSDPDMQRNPALLQGAAQYLHAQRGRHLSAQLVYADRLAPVTRWYAQLWAESLGKRDAAGKHQGLTPLAARGVTDQHSQLQLYLDGPDDKQFTFIADPTLKHQGPLVSERARSIEAIKPLAGHTLGEMFYAEFEATRATLTRRGRPNRTFSLTSNPYALGELII